MSPIRGKRARPNLTAMLLIVIASCLFFNAKANADVKIIVSFTDIEHEVEPHVAEHSVARTSTIILTSDHKLKSEFDYGWGGHTGSAVIELGKPYRFTTFAGFTYVSRWNIVNGAIVHTNLSESYSFSLRITTNGIDSCTAIIQYKLNPGHKFFEDKRMSNHEDMKDSDKHAENIACTISAISN